MYPNLSFEQNNILLDLCFDGFHLYIQSSNMFYSHGLIIVTPYNLFSKKCITKPFIFLSCVMLGLSNPNDGIDIFFTTFN